MAGGRFRFPKTIEEEEPELCVERAVPKSTRRKKKSGQEAFLRIGNEREV